MPSIPLPFVISLLLCLILVRMIRQGERKLGLFPLLVATFAAQAVLSGLNWNVGWHPARFIQPVVAAVLPALSFAAFNQLRRNRLARPTDMLPHLVPASYCDTDAFNASLCGWVRQSGVDLHAMDMQPAGRNNEGKRIEFAMAIDPAPVDVFQTNTLSKVSIPVEIVNLGQPGTIPRTALASETAKAIPKGTYSTIEDASHYSMFGECKPDAAEMAESERIGDPICSDGGGQSRLEIHKKLAKLVTDAFNRELKTDRWQHNFAKISILAARLLNLKTRGNFHYKHRSQRSGFCDRFLRLLKVRLGGIGVNSRSPNELPLRVEGLTDVERAG